MCEYCDASIEGKSFNGTKDVGRFTISGEYLEATYDNDFYSISTRVNFCPMCGEKLRG